ncbi:hypothetical protein KUW00_15550 [Halomonas sp. DP5N14-9]|uniref:hypothetical protein n=1 Tax=unclassified Halomonas TaxID=2609666 RepID=UPI000D385D82|nr:MULTISPECIES: hypothetical protein [unclassified Halomonas]MBY5942294.1 hypothetical protein [Halomonas sp. DP5N14-9]
MPRPDEHQFLRYVLREDTAAIAAFKTISRVSQTLDDLIDKDRPVSDGDVISAFWMIIVELPANPFYRANEIYLRPLLASALSDWRVSVALERDGDAHGRHLAFVLRDQLAGVLCQMAYLVGGEQWMNQVAVEIRRHVHEDTLSEYITDLDSSYALNGDRA